MIWPLLALASPIRIAFLGNSPTAQELTALVGSGYEIKWCQTLAQVQNLHPAFVITSIGAHDSTESMDTIVPNLKHTLSTITHLDSHPKVLLCLPSTITEQDREFMRPLTIQAARESNVATIDSPDGSSLGYAEMLYSQVVDWKAAKTGWKLVSADSEETDEGPAQNAIDGNPDTYWHTQYSPKATKYPHEIVVDMGESKSIGGFRCLPRQDGGTNGRIKQYEFYVSDDGSTWSEPVAKGSFKNTMDATMVPFKTPATGRYIKLRAITEQTGEPYASIAELDVLPPKFATGG